MMKNIKVHIKTFSDKIASDSPVNTISTPIIIGFLTYLYIPSITSFPVGLHGASVPLPILTNFVIVSIIIYKPVNISRRPASNANIL